MTTTEPSKNEPFNYPAPMMQQLLKNKFEIEKMMAKSHATDKSARVKLSGLQ